MARTSAVAVLRDRLISAVAERDALRAAIAAIPRHRRYFTLGLCSVCGATWPCPTEQAHRLTNTSRVAGANPGNQPSVGSGCDTDPGAVTPDPAHAGRSSDRAAPKDTQEDT